MHLDNLAPDCFDIHHAGISREMRFHEISNIFL
jgi:hypothetical protein